jgi:hypothetical protein
MVFSFGTMKNFKPMASPYPIDLVCVDRFPFPLTQLLDFNVLGRSPPKMDILRSTARRGGGRMNKTNVFPRSSFGSKPFVRRAFLGNATPFARDAPSSACAGKGRTVGGACSAC